MKKTFTLLIIALSFILFMPGFTSTASSTPYEDGIWDDSVSFGGEATLEWWITWDDADTLKYTYKLTNTNFGNLAEGAIPIDYIKVPATFVGLASPRGFQWESDSYDHTIPGSGSITPGSTRNIGYYYEEEAPPIPEYILGLEFSYRYEREDSGGPVGVGLEHMEWVQFSVFTDREPGMDTFIIEDGSHTMSATGEAAVGGFASNNIVDPVPEPATLLLLGSGLLGLAGLRIRRRIAKK